jgi:hypothetical protein
MNQLDARRAARLAASDTHPSRTRTSRLVLRAVQTEVQDHQVVRDTPRGYWCSAHVHRFQRRSAKLHSFRMIQTYQQRSRSRFRLPSVVRVDPPISRSWTESEVYQS